MQQSTQPKIELLVDEKALLGEGPSWSAKDQVLYWVNILEKKIYVYNPATQRNDTIVIKQHPGCVVPRQKTNSSVVIAGTDEVSSGFSFVGNFFVTTTIAQF
jgi:sugar lactone lactonase YvrE